MIKSKSKRALKLKERRDVIKKNVSEYFLHFSRFHRSWFHELAMKYKESNCFPMLPMVILPSYYERSEDKEIAIFAALLIKEDCDIGNILAFKKMMGESPWEWFKNREFVKLSLGSVQLESVGGVRGWRIARLFDRLWEECNDFNYKWMGAKNLGDVVENISKTHCCRFFDTLTYLLEDCGVGNYFYKLRLLLLILSSSDGIGIGLWKEYDKVGELKCPLFVGIRQFVSMWFPDWKRFGDLDDVIKLFGFERNVDFFYAWLGYKELQKRNPKGCGLYSTRYATWYELSTQKKKHKWAAIQPKISF